MNSTTLIHINPNIKHTGNMKTKHTVLHEKPKIPTFDELLLETVDSTLSTLVNSSKQIIYSYLEKRYNIKREAIPNNIATFVQALEEIFGQASLLIEAKIMQTLHSKVPDFKYLPKEELSFVDYAKNLRIFLQRPPQV